MKRIYFFIVFVILAFNVNALDIIILKNQMHYAGKITKIKDCSIIFVMDGDKYEIPASDLYFVCFEDINNRVYKKYLKLSENGLENCLAGKLDAGSFHGKKVGHFFLGALFGPFAILGTLLSSPNPYKGKETVIMSKNKDLFSDPAYLKCYKKRAKAELIGMEAIGWGVWILFILGSNS